jgi:hypothetical protein
MEEVTPGSGYLEIVARAVALYITLNLNSHPFLKEFSGMTVTETTTHYIITLYCIVTLYAVIFQMVSI